MLADTQDMRPAARSAFVSALLVLPAALCACGGGASSTAPPVRTIPTSTPASTPTPSPEPTSTAAAVWPTFHQNSQHTGASPVSENGHVVALAWKFKTGGEVASSPAVGAGGLIYFGSDDGYLYCLNADGTLRWKLELGTGVTSGVTLNVQTGMIYVAAGNSEYAVNANGTLAWSFATGRAIIANATLSPSNTTLYVVSFDHYLYALNAATGTVNWKFMANDGMDATPTVSTAGTIYAGSYDYNLYSLTDTGSGYHVNWSFDTLFLVESTAVIDSCGNILSTNDLGLVWPVSPLIGGLNNVPNFISTGSPLYASIALSPITTPNGSGSSCADVSGITESIFAADANGQVLKYSFPSSNLGLVLLGATQQVIFTSRLPFFSSPAVSADNLVFIGGQDKTFYEFNGTSDQLMAAIAIGGAVDSSPAIGSDGTVYIGAADGYLYAFR